jgi:enoyl-CoA hydratase
MTVFTMRLADRIASQPHFALTIAKEAVNSTRDNQGRAGSTKTTFTLHQLCHSHSTQLFDQPIDPTLMASFSGTAVWSA